MKTTLILCLILFASCSGSSGRDKKERIITVTIEPQRYFAEAIAGDKFKVVSMVPKGSSPETYDPTPQQLVALDKSDAYLRIGYIGFELTWMEKLTQNAPQLLVFDTSEGIDLIQSEGEEHRDHVHPGGIEPHIWNSAPNARIIAENTCKALCTLDKENEAFYTARYDSLALVIQRTDSIISHLLAKDADRAFLIYHPALSYFAWDYGLTQVPIEESGREPSPAYLKKLIDTCEKEKINVIFVQPEFDKRNAEVIAQQAGLEIVPINPLAYNWVEEMIYIAQSLKQNNGY